MSEIGKRIIANHVHVLQTESVLTVGFTNDPDNITEYVLLQLDINPSRQDLEVGLGGPHIEIGDQRCSGYDAVECVSLSEREVRIELFADAALRMSVPREITILIADQQTEIGVLASLLQRMLAGSFVDLRR